MSNKDNKFDLEKTDKYSRQYNGGYEQYSQAGDNSPNKYNRKARNVMNKGFAKYVEKCGGDKKQAFARFKETALYRQWRKFIFGNCPADDEKEAAYFEQAFKSSESAKGKGDGNEHY